MIYDILIVGILIYSAMRGAKKGIVWQLATIAALVMCFLFSESASLVVAPYIGLQPPLNRWVSMFVLYAGFSFAAFGAARVLHEVIEKAKFVEYDRHLGGVLGLLKGAVFAVVLTFFAVTLSERGREHILGSYTGLAAAHIMAQLEPVMPAGLQEVIDPYIDRFNVPHNHIATGEEGDPEHPGHTGDDPFAIDGDVSSLDPEKLVSQLPSLGTEELRKLALEALRNTAPADRVELVKSLSAQVPGVVRAVAEEWRFGKPAAASTRAEQEKLLEDIAAIYSDHADAQGELVGMVEGELTGVPDQVRVAVLRDWHHDLMAVGQQSDPDPKTDISTALNRRILRQLEAARIPLKSLGSALQSRLTQTR